MACLYICIFVCYIVLLTSDKHAVDSICGIMLSYNSADVPVEKEIFHAGSTLSDLIHWTSRVCKSFGVNLLGDGFLLLRIVSLTELSKVGLQGLIYVVCCRIQSTRNVYQKNTS